MKILCGSHSRDWLLDLLRCIKQKCLCGVHSNGYLYSSTICFKLTPNKKSDSRSQISAGQISQTWVAATYCCNTNIPPQQHKCKQISSETMISILFLLHLCEVLLWYSLPHCLCPSSQHLLNARRSSLVDWLLKNVWFQLSDSFQKWSWDMQEIWSRKTDTTACEDVLSDWHKSWTYPEKVISAASPKPEHGNSAKWKDLNLSMLPNRNKSTTYLLLQLKLFVIN